MKVRILTAAGLMVAALLTACAVTEGGERTIETEPLADSLSQTFSQLKQVVLQRREDLLADYLSHDLLRGLRDSLAGQGYVSVTDYLALAYRNVPEPDTLLVAGLVTGKGYARLTLQGRGSRLLRRQEMIQYTFVLFRHEDDRWKFVAVSGLEKERRDPYGTELAVLETELQPRFRFPRLF